MAGKGSGKKTGGKTGSPAKPLTSKDSVSCIVNKVTVATLCDSLNQLKISLGQTSDQQQNLDIGEQVDIREVISNLIAAVQAITSNVNKIKSTQEEQETKIRWQGDEIDEIRQRGFMGNVIVSSLPNQTQGKISLIKTDEELRREKITMQSHIISLVQEKYDITIPESDIQACHRFPNKSVLLKIWNRKEGSAWENLVRKIKSPENSSFNVYFNFQLTNKRSNLLYECQMLKKTGKIDKFYSDENGHIKLKIKKDSNDKVRITYVSKNPQDIPITFTKEELGKLFV